MSDKLELPKPKFTTINPVIVSAFFEKTKQLFADPLTYATALGVWAYNIFVNSKVIEIGDDYSLVLVKTPNPLLVLFFDMASHYFNVKGDDETLKNIEAQFAEEFVKDLKKATDEAYLIVNNLYYKIDQHVVTMMYKQYTVWALGMLYGFFVEEFEKVADFVLQSNFPVIKLLRGEIRFEFPGSHRRT